MPLPSIPFTLPDIHGGFTEVEGAVYLDEEFVVLDFKVVTLGGLRKKERLVKIEPRALAFAELRTGLFKDRICLGPKKSTLLEAVPGEHRGDLQLRVWRNRRQDARRLVQEIQARMSASHINTEEEVR